MGHTHSISGNYDAAAVWYRRAADNGDHKSMFHLGWLHEAQSGREFGRPNNPEGEPFKLMSYLHHRMQTDKTAKPDESIDQSHLGEAIVWYERSASRGFGPAMNNLAQIHMDARTGHKDIGLAYKWHLRAARAGNPVARWNLSVLTEGNYGIRNSHCSVQQWAMWHPNDEEIENLITPVFERTVIMGSLFTRGELESIRDSAKIGQSMQFYAKAYVPLNESRFQRVNTNLDPNVGDDPVCFGNRLPLEEIIDRLPR